MRCHPPSSSSPDGIPSGLRSAVECIAQRHLQILVGMGALWLIIYHDISASLQQAMVCGSGYYLVDSAVLSQRAYYIC